MPPQLVERDARIGLRHIEPLGSARHALRLVNLDEYLQPVDIQLGHWSSIKKRYWHYIVFCLYEICLLAQTGAISQEETAMNRISDDVPVLVAGGGIGGLAAALARTRQGFAVKVLEQAPQLGEIGAGIQLGPNGFAAFDALGIGEKARGRAVYTDEMVMHDALDETLVGRIPTGEAFRRRFGNPYAVIHRADVHKSLLEGAQESDRIEVATSTTVQRVDQQEDGVTVHDARGGRHH